ncbi:GxxExxY protein [Pelagerythrobacter aerophilus]|uniref:GxxExxY protein n=1 Tax=Pelagerythrobacter aerophilus TaxID=2306995 RepID=A0A418NM91_9SPHN|nr:GxxExxY protein [Pelagerythrobacter aerophilus]RIV81440.1 GxxExxY protein [Pelagerythrobacter aerophilus]
MQPIDAISSDVVGEAIRIHRELGPGLLESVYEAVLAGALVKRGYAVARQVPVAIDYDDLHFGCAFRIDLLVENRLILEIKSVEKLTKLHAKQLLTYLRLTKQPVGLLLNFSGLTMKEGIRRLVNDYRPDQEPSAISAASARTN